MKDTERSSDTHIHNYPPVMPPPGPPKPPSQVILLAGLGGAAIGLFLIYLGFVAPSTLFEVVGIVLIPLSLGVGITYHHWAAKEEHRRQMDLLPYMGQPEEDDGLPTYVAWLQEVVKDILHFGEAAKVRAHDEVLADKNHRTQINLKQLDLEIAANQQAIKQAISDAELSGQYQQLLTRLAEEYRLLELKLQYDKSDGSEEAARRSLLINQAINDLSKVTEISDTNVREIAFRAWKQMLSNN